MPVSDIPLLASAAPSLCRRRARKTRAHAAQIARQTAETLAVILHTPAPYHYLLPMPFVALRSPLPRCLYNYALRQASTSANARDSSQRQRALSPATQVASSKEEMLATATT